jgi:hypothetical protein
MEAALPLFGLRRFDTAFVWLFFLKKPQEKSGVKAPQSKKRQCPTEVKTAGRLRIADNRPGFSLQSARLACKINITLTNQSRPGSRGN